jgi:hypothetical protein
VPRCWVFFSEFDIDAAEGGGRLVADMCGGCLGAGENLICYFKCYVARFPSRCTKCNRLRPVAARDMSDPHPYAV